MNFALDIADAFVLGGIMSLYSDRCLGCGTTQPPVLNAFNELVCSHCSSSFSLEKVKDPMRKRLLIAAGIILGVFLLGMQWGQYTLEVIPLQAKRYIGMASGADYGRLAMICKEMHDATCVEEMLIAQSEAADTTSIAALAELGQVQFQLEKPQLAVQSLQRYFFAGGEDTHAKYTLARALAQIGQTDEAAKTYQELIDSKPDVIMHTVMESYVQLLMKTGQFHKAKELILATQKRGDNTAGFMEGKLRQIASVEK